jgi:3-ketosteroid 9alpha-monooxygenase subunit A
VREHSGFVWAWYHKDGGEPAFKVPAVAQYGDSDWTSDWIRFEWTVKTHPQEIYENAADWAHFSFVHGFDMPSDIDTQFEGPVYHWA